MGAFARPPCTEPSAGPSAPVLAPERRGRDKRRTITHGCYVHVLAAHAFDAGWLVAPGRSASQTQIRESKVAAPQATSRAPAPRPIQWPAGASFSIRTNR